MDVRLEELRPLDATVERLYTNKAGAGHVKDKGVDIEFRLQKSLNFEFRTRNIARRTQDAHYSLWNSFNFAVLPKIVLITFLFKPGAYTLPAGRISLTRDSMTVFQYSNFSGK